MVRSQVRVPDRITRFSFDYQLICALLDRWRPETHTFQLPVDEIALTLQDVVLLLRLPCAGQEMGAVDVVSTWREDFIARFIPRNDSIVGHYQEFISTHRPTSRWLQFNVRTSTYYFIMF